MLFKLGTLMLQQVPRLLLHSLTLSLHKRWDKLLSHQVKLCVPGPGLFVDREALKLDDDEQCGAAACVFHDCGTASAQPRQGCTPPF